MPRNAARGLRNRNLVSQAEQRDRRAIDQLSGGLPHAARGSPDFRVCPRAVARSNLTEVTVATETVFETRGSCNAILD